MEHEHRRSRELLILGALALLVGVAGCTNAVSMTAAPSANAPQCADVQVRLPDTVASKYALRNTNAQSTAAWGDPTVLILHCGVPVPVVSDLPCFSLGTVDWIRDGSKKNAITFTTFGRSPAVQVTADAKTYTNGMLSALSGAVGALPRDGHRCLDPQDVRE
ncbi:DUF3515 family protein [Curtobacterium sp. SL109]|uniref:DUF3515 family protein n=1 Tax=Curtobacterium sp. SL109 TaxID=2994662 RepID=UPI002273A0CE|nr:DUF3515 family protein [Curtobacterium sp. SL109]MCY1692808.1 DUF3515 family protein [Curtobacterium sp. SL109]